MPPKSRILMLPDDVRGQLDERLRASNFGDIMTHTAWLNSLGHAVGKTAVGQYSLANRARIKAGGRSWVSTKNELAAKIAAQRIECLKVAVSLCPSESLEALESAFELADRLMVWAYRE